MNKLIFIFFLFFLLAIASPAFSQNQISEKDSIYEVVEVDAKPIGGMSVVYKTLARNIPACFSKESKRMGIDSKYVFQFVISEKGRIEENSFKVLRPKEGISEDCAFKMEEVLSQIIWKPAEHDCKKVRQRILFPLLVCLK